MRNVKRLQTAAVAALIWLVLLVPASATGAAFAGGERSPPAAGTKEPVARTDGTARTRDDDDDDDDDESEPGGEDDDDDDDEDDEDRDDDESLDEYDGVAPDRVWRSALGLTRVQSGYDGDGVTVAVIDTGVSRVSGLDGAVAARVDFTPGLDGVDHFGHGTHVAGLIAGGGGDDDGGWRSVARDARLVSLKVAGPDGATDVSVVLSALQWVVTHRQEYGIRVLNLSYGTDSRQSYLVDPLDYALERVWKSGILVVTAAGNDGPGPGTVTKPADDPFVVTVGAADLGRTAARDDDRVAEFSSRGPTADGAAKPDLVAPGISLVSLRAPGSAADLLRPSARVGGRYFKGTGTSQAAAIVSGVAALMFDANPALTPDGAKAALLASAHGNLAGAPGGGAGLVDAAGAVRLAVDTRFLAAVPAQAHELSTGLGLLDGSRGSFGSYSDPDGNGQSDPAAGELDALGHPWDAAAFASWWTAPSWTGTSWAPLVATGRGWRTPTGNRATWPGLVWDPDSWTARHWGGSGWVARHWGARHWGARHWAAWH